MSAALDAMVKAMADEIKRQVAMQMDSGPGVYPGVEVEEDGLVVFENTGAFCLEKVARAGLAAIRDIDIDVPEAEALEVYGVEIGGLATASFEMTIDKILGGE